MAKKQAVANISLGRTGGVLPDGIYKVRVKAMELKQGQKSPYLATQLTVEGRSSTVFTNIMLADNVRWRFEQFLDAVEAPTKGNMSVSKLISFSRGKVVYVKLGNEEYNGQLKNNVVQFLVASVALQMLEDSPTPTVEDPEDDDEDMDDGEDSEEEDDDDWGDDSDEDDEDEDEGEDDGPAKDKMPF